MQPTIGRIVHYTTIGDLMVCPAIITGLNADGTVALHVMCRTGGKLDLVDVAYSDATEAAAGSEEARGKWTWPAGPE